MADLIGVKVTPNTNSAAVTDGGANYTVLCGQVECQVVDSADQSIVLADFTGANALQFPRVLSTLTAEQAATVLEYLWPVFVALHLQQLAGTL